MIRAGLATLAGALLLPVLVIAAASGGIGFAPPAQAALQDIPPDYLILYEQAGLAYDVPWELVAAIGKVECDHGRNPDPACWKDGATNRAGAGGPMQFLAATWAAYGVDANRDGTTDRWSAADAIFAAANYLQASGAPKDIPAALYAYNHSPSYVEQVLHWATLYKNKVGNTASNEVGGGPAGAPTQAAAAAVGYALAQLGTPYRWGGERPGGFDCSGLIEAAYQAAGIELPRTAQQQYDAGPPLTAGQPPQPGDLVFFGADPGQVGHVGLMISQTEMVDAPHTGAVVRVESYQWGDYLGATRPVTARPGG